MFFRDVCSPSRSPRLPDRLTECLSSKCKENEALINLWQTATNALSVCVNSPRNSMYTVYTLESLYYIDCMQFFTTRLHT